MALEISDAALKSIEQIAVDQNVIFKIDGINEIFGAADIFKNVIIGDPDLFIGDFIIGGTISDPNSRPWVSKQGSSSDVGQQIEPDKGAASSITSFLVRLIDKNGFLSQIFSPGNRVPDLIGRRGEVWISANQSAFPNDSIRLFVGIITGIKFGASFADITVSHPDQLRRGKILQKYNNKLNGAINNSQTIIAVDTIGNFVFSQDALTSYIRIGDEIIEVGGFSGNSFTSCIRGSLGTIAESHSDNDDIESFYVLSGDPIDLSLKILHSNGGSPYLSGLPAVRFNQVTDTLNISNAIFIASNDVYFDYGIVEGDLITTTGAANGSNNVSNKSIQSIVEIDEGSYLIIDGVTFLDEIDSNAVMSIKSQYNTLPQSAGLDIRAEFIDTKRYREISAFLGLLPSVDLYVTDEKDGKEFIEQQLYFPFNLYSIPRQSKISINALLPPLANNETPVLDSDNIVAPNEIEVVRDLNKFFYNAVVYRFNRDVLEEKYLAGEIYQSSESTARINIGNKPYQVDSDGLRDTPTVRAYLQSASQRILARYKFGAELFNIRPIYRAGLTIDIGDTIIINGDGLNIYDSINASRQFQSRVLEVINKSYNIFDGRIELICADTSYGLDRRYGVFGPSSKIDAGSSTSVIRLKRSFDDSGTGQEINKWIKYIGMGVIIRDIDYTSSEEATILRQHPTIPNALEILPALTFAPNENDIIEMANYQNADPVQKAIHCFAGPRVIVTSGTGSDIITVGAGDIGKFFEGATVRVHSADFGVDSGDVKIISITGNDITVDDMGFTALSGYEVDLIGFSSDDGAPYVYY